MILARGTTAEDAFQNIGVHLFISRAAEIFATYGFTWVVANEEGDMEMMTPTRKDIEYHVKKDLECLLDPENKSISVMDSGRISTIMETFEDTGEILIDFLLNIN